MKEYKFKIGSKDYAATVEEQEGGKLQVTLGGQTYQVEIPETKAKAPRVIKTQAAPAAAPVAAPAAAPAAGGAKTVCAPLPGTVTKISVKVGDAVNAGDTVLLMEAMKMENNITAEFGGTVKAILVEAGAQVQSGQALIDIE